MSYDDWKTTEPDDYPACEIHGYKKPCGECRMEALERRADEQRDEMPDVWED